MKKNTSKSNPLTLREFIYLDRVKVQDFLSSIEDGLTQEITQTVLRRGGTLEGKIKAAVAEAGMQSGFKEVEEEELKRMTDAALFQRLHNYMRTEKLMRVITSLRPDEYGSIEIGDILEIDSQVELSSLDKIFDGINSMMALVNILSPGQIDRETTEAVNTFNAIASRSAAKGLNVKASLLDPDSKYAFTMTLPKAKLRVTKEEVEGRNKVLCRITRTLSQNETVELFSLMPGLNVNRTQIRQIIQSFKTMPAELGKPIKEKDLRIAYPAAVVTPIAIYR